MRVVTRMEDVKEQFERAHSEAVKAFGNGSIFIERQARFSFLASSRWKAYDLEII